jgi:ATP-dependent metalloprotease FtsH
MDDNNAPKIPPPGGPTGPRPTPPKPPAGGQFFRNLLTGLFILLLIVSVYSLIAGNHNHYQQISLSQVAADISAGKVTSIIVNGDNLEVHYDNTSTLVKDSMKESETSLTQSLVDYGVTPNELDPVQITIADQTGLGFWIFNLAPFILPLIAVLLIAWFITRQVRGAGMQAFTFGQSKARMISPDDKKQRVTFKDVAGAKEAKEELSEIVDFLKNPRKFLEIGARIPKGILLMGAPGTGKCVTGDTKILTGKGPVAIDEIPKYFSVNQDSTVDGLKVISLDPNNLSFKTTFASHWYDLGEQETYKINTDNGMAIEGTPEHPIVVVDKGSGNFIFRRLDEIAVSDWVVASYNTRLFGNYTKLPDPEAAYLLGVLTGDGCLTVKGRVALTTADQEVLDRVQTITKKLFGHEFSKTSSRPYDYELRDVEAKAKLLEWGLAETYASGKTVSEWVRLAPESYIRAYLAGLFDTDGYVEKYGAVGFSSASQMLVDEIYAMLLNLGIVARKYERKKKYNGKLQYYISVYGDFVEAFRREIGFTIARKQRSLEALCDRQRNTNINVIPLQTGAVATLWRVAVEETGLTLDRAFYNQSLYKNTKRYMSGERMPSQAGLTTFLAGVSEIAPTVKMMPEFARLSALSSGQFFFTKVKSKEKGRAKVYDLTVPHFHNFIANGLVNHNTLLARAVAGEAQVAFFSISGSEFVEMFVGVGASRVRDLFKLAKAAAPAIIFVDEIDAVGRVRGTGVGGGNDEREQTLNQILVEMDGFEPNEKVIVMAATNRPDVLDPALLRPGRFDRRVTIDLPDRGDRLEILKIHSRAKPFGEDVKLETIAERTPGFSGADLYSLMNEGAILAARENRTKISQYDLIRSIEKVMLGPERRSHVLSMKEKEITAYHEAGHAVVASVLPNADPVHKISIISRGRAAGYTLKLPIEDRRLQARREFLDDIAMSLGGYVTEKMVFGDLTTGPSNDLQVSTALARDMVTRYGMSDKLGPIALEGEGGQALFGRGVGEKDYSQKVADLIDSEVSRIMTEAQKKAEDILIKNRKLLDVIAKRLIETETIEREEFDQILVANGITPKRKVEV